MKKTANVCEYEVDINAIIANFVCSWKCRMISIMLSEKSWGQPRLLSIRSTSPLQDYRAGFVSIFYLVIISIAGFGLFRISLFPPNKQL